MNRIKRLICEDCAKKRRYFHEAEREITEKNLRLLKTVSLSIAMLLLFFYAVTPIILPSWHITCLLYTSLGHLPVLHDN